MGLFDKNDLDEVKKINFQYSNMWDFYLLNSAQSPLSNIPSSFENKLKFYVKTINFPTFKLNTERLSTGEVVYTGYSFPDVITISIYEDSGMNTLKYFSDWQDMIFDRKTMRFKVLTGKEYIAFKTGILRLYNYEANLNVILGTLFNATARNMIEPLIRTKLKIPKSDNTLNNNLTKTALSTASIVGNRGFEELKNTYVPQVYKKVSAILTFNKLKVVGIEQAELSYETGEPLVYNIQMEVETFDLTLGGWNILD